jgi:hypothetical protein
MKRESGFVHAQIGKDEEMEYNERVSEKENIQ